LGEASSSEKPNSAPSPSGKISRRRFVKYGVAAVVVAAAAGAGAYYYLSQPGLKPGPSKSQVNIGFSIALSGPNEAAGLDQFQTYKQWAALTNAAGGLQVGSSKLPIALTYYDDTGDPNTAISLYERLITEDKVDLILPPWGTYMHYALIPTVTKYGYPLVANTADTDDVFTLPSPFYYFQGWSHQGEVTAMMNAINANTSVITGGVKRNINIAMPWAESLGPDEVGHDAFDQAEAAGNFNIINNSSYDPSTTDFSSLVLDIKAGNPDVILAGTYPSDSELFTAQLIESNVSPAVLYEWVGPFFPFFQQKFGQNSLGICSLGQLGADPSAPAMKPWADDFLTRYGGPVPIGDYGFILCSLQILQQAVANAGTLDLDTIQSHLLSDTFTTVNGQIAFHGRPYPWEPQFKVEAANQWITTDVDTGNVPIWGLQGPTNNKFLVPKPAWTT